MPEDAKPPDEIAYQRVSWRIQRLGWIGMGALLVAALAGGLGDGPLAQARIQDGAATIDYERILRVGRESEFDIAAAPGEAVRIELSGAVVGTLTLLGAMPPRSDLVLTRDSVALPMAAEERGAVALLRFEPNDAGYFTATIGVNERRYPIRLLVLP